MNQFAQDMLDIISSTKLPEVVRDRAQSALQNWRNGITPSPKTMKFLKDAQKPAGDCARLANDGSCEWLRKRGAGYKLPVPPKGQRAMCIYPTAGSSCPGFKKVKI